MLDLAYHINAYIIKSKNPFLIQSIFRTAEPNAVAAIIDTFCENQLGSAIAESFFFESSQGCVFGVCLKDQRHIVIKAYNPHRTTDFLRSVATVQLYLAQQGYPCPRPLLGPIPLQNSHVIVEELVDEGTYLDAHDPNIRRSMAEMLARQIQLTNQIITQPEIQLAAFNKGLSDDELWPIPHDELFNFKTTTKGAEWIDEIGWQAKSEKASGAGRAVLGHTDWSVKHFRYVGDKVRIIYDWDSLTFDKEPSIIASAAATFTMTWFIPVNPLLPTREEALAFIAEYEAARGVPFTTAERKTMAAAATYSLAYGARCMHSIDPHATTFEAGSPRDLLSTYRDKFLVW